MIPFQYKVKAVFIFVLIITIRVPSVILGKIFWICFFWFRGYARNAVHNYFIKNPNPSFVRLQYDKIKLIEPNKYGIFYYGFDKPMTGYIHKRNVSKVEFYFAFFVWCFSDDDSSLDVTSQFHVELWGKPQEATDKTTEINGKHYDIGVTYGSEMEKYFIKGDYIADNIKIHNYFKLIYFGFLWMNRNSFYNLRYILGNMIDNYDVIEIIENTGDPEYVKDLQEGEDGFLDLSKSKAGVCKMWLHNSTTKRTIFWYNWAVPFFDRYRETRIGWKPQGSYDYKITNRLYEVKK